MPPNNAFSGFFGNTAFDAFEAFDSSTNPAPNNAFGDILEFETQIPFQGALQRANLTPNLQRKFRGQRDRFFNQFQGLLDQQIRAGQTPDLRFADFAQNIDFRAEAFNESPSQRFGDTSRFDPRTSFIR